ncbi:hypothetical protein CR513_38857, partial [Mucuna pruriens]
MTLVACFDLEFYQMDVKIAFLNGDLCEDKIHLWVEKASKQWYLKFDESICSLGFKENNNGSKFIILVLYIDEILLACNDMIFLLETEQILETLFYMKDLGNTSFVLGIEIHRDRSHGVLGLLEELC